MFIVRQAQSSRLFVGMARRIITDIDITHNRLIVEAIGPKPTVMKANRNTKLLFLSIAFSASLVNAKAMDAAEAVSVGEKHCVPSRVHSLSGTIFLSGNTRSGTPKAFNPRGTDIVDCTGEYFFYAYSIVLMSSTLWFMPTSYVAL